MSTPDPLQYHRDYYGVPATKGPVADRDALDDRDGAHETLEVVRPQELEIERVWATYWQPMLREGGVPRLKAELYDAYFLVDNARKVYRHITGGLCENLGASAEGIIAMADRRVAQINESLLDRIKELEAELRSAERALANINESLNSGDGTYRP